MPEIHDKHYWKAIEERDPSFRESARDEFPAAPGECAGEIGPFNRRSFLKMAGFAVAGGTVASCSPAPLKKAIPYLVQPEEITPGRAYWYASMCGACAAGCGSLTKNRDGRPIKLEGNPTHPLSKGGLCAVGQASILELYDSQRLKTPLIDGKEANWFQVDGAIKTRIEKIKAAGGLVRFLTGTVTSLTTRRAIESFLAMFPGARHIAYDPLSASAILDAHERTHGIRALPHYQLDRADVIVSFDADFLGTWISPVEYTAAWAAGRKPPKMSYHAQFEPRLSVTGSKADRRIRIAPGEIGLALAHLATMIGELAGVRTGLGALDERPVNMAALRDAARRLWEHRGHGLVLCGVNDVETQLIVNLINHQLGSYGATLDIERPSYQRQGNDRDLYALVQEIEAGEVAALFIHGVNPVYDIPLGAALADALKKTSLVVSFAEREDETAAHAHLVCPDHHYLESWNDAEAVAGVVTIAQPAIRPLGETRSLVESLHQWMGTPKAAYDALRDTCRETVFTRQTAEVSFDTFWDKTVHDGCATVDAPPTGVRPFDASAVRSIPPAPRGDVSLVLYPKVGMLDGRHAHNPWLQELPDPISKVSWDNYAAVSPALAVRLRVAGGDVVRVAVAGQSDSALELPVHVQPGQHDGVIAIALGYGRKGTDRFAAVGPQWIEARPTVDAGGLVGKNAAIFRGFDGRGFADWRATPSVSKTGKRSDLASTQIHHTLTVPEKLAAGHTEPRPVVQETTLAAYLENPSSGVPHADEGRSLWSDDHPYEGNRWAMAIDLTACTGCSACVVGCQAENNVSVVGKDEVRRRREMHWIRIDRYYSGEDGDVDTVFQPMLCQQCANAPCETVCPVLATVHSSEGLNQQVYNRCVGTRYCANNCPYKVRRFNWFDYPHQDRLQNMVLNPDVTIRSRGVMEKCSFCIQRIQEAKAEAKRLGVKLKDGDVQVACQQSCPAKAIVFGNLNDPTSAVSKVRRDPRSYRVLAELNVEPSVAYLRLIRNREEGVSEQRG